ncbi:sensor histidine kinase [Streptomyces reniochalinae]|uniref:histidine kinase n=1 Tax=Streptomyces reniochalinae TaxID=2250578 RepID=A0A367EIF0_9ACTN|nr:ATP-binding protein [Streptomyces reniochalinae]RCG17492.1 histidine kinase [Streptomyces reniochalinae]
MISALTARPRPRHVLLGLTGAALGVLVVMEGLNAPLRPVAALTMASGLLCLSAPAAPQRHFPRQAAWAVAGSALVTAVGALTTHRPENTPGMVEAGALLMVLVRAVRRCPPRQAMLLGAVSAAAAVALPLRIERWDSLTLLVMTVIACVGVPFAVVLGLCLRLRDALRARERESFLREQRLGYARDLHDFVAHHVTAIVARTRAARFAAGAGQAPSAEDLDRMLAQIEEAGSQALGSMRAMVSSLRDTSAPAPTRPPGDPQVLRDLVEEFGRTGARAELSLDPRLAQRPLPPETGTTVQRVVQESLTNVRRHAPEATRVTVRVVPRPDDTLEVEVTDDGPQDTAAPGSADGGGFGLVGLTERVEATGGTLTTGPRPGGGWRVLAVLPAKDAAPSR